MQRNLPTFEFKTCTVYIEGVLIKDMPFDGRVTIDACGSIVKIEQRLPRKLLDGQEWLHITRHECHALHEALYYGVHRQYQQELDEIIEGWHNEVPAVA